MIVDPYKGPLYHAKEGLRRNGKKGIFCTGRQEKYPQRLLLRSERRSHHAFHPSKMCCISESEKAKRAEWGGSQYDLNLFHFLNHRLTLIPHISGLSTQWRVHMASFSEMHPNPTSEPYSLLSHTHTHSKLMCSRTRTLGTRRRRLQKSGAVVILPGRSHEPREAESLAISCAALCPPVAFLFTCVSLLSHSLFCAAAQCKMWRLTPSPGPECGAAALKALWSYR